MKISSAEELISEFSDCADHEERTQLILEIGDDLPPLAAEWKTDAPRVRGCTSNLWLPPDADPGEPRRLHFAADSDSQLVRGLIAVLLSLVNDRTPAEILAVDLEGIFAKLELARFISRSRSNGLASMVRRVRDLARKHDAAA